MKLKRIAIKAAIIISVLLLIFKGVLMYRNYASYKEVIHQNANNIIKIHIDGIAKTLVYNAIKNPSFYLGNKTKKDTTVKKEKVDKAYTIPANIFLYTVKGKNPSTIFTSFKISDKEAFKDYIKNQYKIEDFNDLESLTIGSNKDRKFQIAFNSKQCVVVYNPNKEVVNDVFTDLLINGKNLKKGDANWSKLKDANAHISYISDTNNLSLNFINGVIDLEGVIELPKGLKLPTTNTYPKFSDEASLTLYLNALSTQTSKVISYKDFIIETDTINKYYKGNFALEIADVTEQEDTIVTYEYNDDFEKVETLSVVKKQVPEITLQWVGKGNKLYQYLENKSIIQQGNFNKTLFPLYQFTMDTTSNGLIASTNLTKTITAGNTQNEAVFGLDINFQKLKDQNHYPLLNPYLESLSTLVIKGKNTSESTIDVNGELLLKDKKINALGQLVINKAE